MTAEKLTAEELEAIQTFHHNCTGHTSCTVGALLIHIKALEAELVEAQQLALNRLMTLETVQDLLTEAEAWPGSR